MSPEERKIKWGVTALDKAINEGSVEKVAALLGPPGVVRASRSQVGIELRALQTINVLAVKFDKFYYAWAHPSCARAHALSTSQPRPRTPSDQPQSNENYKTYGMTGDTNTVCTEFGESRKATGTPLNLVSTGTSHSDASECHYQHVYRFRPG